MSLPPVLSLQPTAGSLHTRRCVRHPQREAAARCPACGGFFCRECVVEHEGRVLCANCLAKEAASLSQRKKRRAKLRRALSLAAACAVAWFAFYILGATLMKIPPDFHDTRLWRDPDTERP